MPVTGHFTSLNLNPLSVFSHSSTDDNFSLIMASSSFMHRMHSTSLPQTSDIPSFLGLVNLRPSLQNLSQSDFVYPTNAALAATKICTITCGASSGTYRVSRGGKNAASGGRNWTQNYAPGENSSDSSKDDKQDSSRNFDSTDQRQGYSQRRGSVYRGSSGNSRGGYEKSSSSSVDDNAEGHKTSRGNYNGVEFRDPGRAYRGSRGIGSSSGGYRSSRTSSFNGSNRDDYRRSGREFDSGDQRQTYGENRTTSFRNSGMSNRGSTGYRSSRSSSYKENDSRYGGQEVGESRSLDYRDSGRNNRGSRGAYGNARGGGNTRYDALRRQAERKMHKGAYEMVDDETGEKVIVWGVEDDDHLPKPSGLDLKWKATTMAVAGDVSEEGWYKAMEAQIAGPSGAFSVKGVRQGGVYDDEEDEDEDEDEEGEFDEDSDYESAGEEEPLETFSTTSQTHASKVVRSVKVRLFGRDFRGKDFVTSEKSHEFISDKENQVTGNNSRDERGTEVQDRNFVIGFGSTNNDESVLPVEETNDRAWPPAGPLKIETFQEDARESHEDSTRRGADGSSAGPSSRNDSSSNFLVEEVTDQPWPPTGPLSPGSFGGLFSRKSFEDPREVSSESEVLIRDSEEVCTELQSSGAALVERGYGSVEGSIIPEANRPSPFGELKPSNFSESQSKRGSRSNSTSWPPRGGMIEGSNRSTDLSYLREDGNSEYHEEEGTACKQEERRPSVGRRQNVWRSVERVVREEDWQAGMNPGIIDIDEDNGDEDHYEAEVTSATKLKNQRSAKELKAWKNTELVKREGDWQGGMNPGIVEINEVDEVEFLRKEQKVRDSVPVRANLLDSLRIQTHRKLGSKLDIDKHTVPEVDTVGRCSEYVTREVGGATELDNSDVTEVKPSGYRDLQARSNFDPTLAAEFFSQRSFKDVGASEDVIGALMSLQVARPSAIQAMAFKPVLEGQSCIVADQTGSGKTLAYVAPLVQSLREEEAKGAAKTLSKKPRVLVLVPTSELAVQVLNVCRAFSKGGAPFRSIVLTGGFKWKTQVESLAQGADVVIATPGRFFKHLQTGSLQLDNLKCAVLDEVDILYDDQEFAEVLQMVEQFASKRLQYVHVTATLPVDIHDSLLARYPDSLPLMGPSLHRTAVGLQEILVDCSGAEGEEKTPEAAFLSKKSALLQLVDQRPVSKTIIFCNKIETCRRVENVLGRHDRSGTKLTVLPYHAALSQEARLESMQQFLESQPKKNLFLVCTDRASRGLDSFDVEHVVLFDYPRDPSEYVRRVGRTARGAGGTGNVFVFALGKQVAMARRTMARNEKGHPIHNVPGSEYET